MGTGTTRRLTDLMVVIVLLAAAAATGAASRAGGITSISHGPLRLPGSTRLGDAALLAAAISTAVLLLTLVVLLLRRPRRGKAEERFIERPATSLWAQAAAVVFVLAVLAVPVATFILSGRSASTLFSTHASLPAAHPTPRPRSLSTPNRPPGHRGSGASSLAVILGIGAFAVAGLVVLNLRPAPETHAKGEEEADDVSSLATATEYGVAAARRAVAAPGSARRAVIDSYVAMSSALARSLPANNLTPRRLLDRAVGANLVAEPPARVVVSMFEKARFSSHPVSEDDRRQVERALASLQHDLTDRVPR